MSGIIGVSPNMKSGVVGGMKLGQVLGFQKTDYAGAGFADAAGGWAFNAEYTPVKTNSTIVSRCYATYYGNNDGMQRRMYIAYRSLGATDTALNHTGRYLLYLTADQGNEKYMHNGVLSAYSTDCVAGSTYTFRIYLGSGNEDDAIHIYGGDGKAFHEITEYNT